MKAVILAGGRGARISEESDLVPKPLIKIGPFPILVHLIKILKVWGFTDVIIALGYKGKLVKEFFDKYEDFDNSSLNIKLIDTGLNTKNGGRVKRIQQYVKGEQFLLLNCDGLTDLNISGMIEQHNKYNKLATVLAVHPPPRFGKLDLMGDQVVNFVEKPKNTDDWINGGIFILESGIFDYINGDTHWEKESAAKLAEDGQMKAYRYEGFWQCMDSMNDKKILEDYWNTKNPPWKIW